MSDVERWGIKPLGEHPCTCEKRIDGVFVRYAHYSELEAERDRLAAENERTREVVRKALEAIEITLEDAYHRAYPECCGQSRYDGCCGNPVPEWTPKDHRILSTLGPIHDSLTALLKEGGGDE